MQERPPSRSEHTGLGLKDGLGSGVSGKRRQFLGAVWVDWRGPEPVFPPGAVLHAKTPPCPPQLVLNLFIQKIK